MRKAKSLFHSANHAINYCARSIAKNAVKEQLRAQGVRVTLVKRLAAFDDPNALPPECHFFVSSKIGWVRLNDDLPQYPEWPPG